MRLKKEEYPPFSAEGFPKKLVDAFLCTADKLNCVVMSRTPGPSTTTLIDERYDLKGFFIKAKSCDWGPMAGFVCMNPYFNKYGAGVKPDGEDYVKDNGEKHRTYLKQLNANEIKDAIAAVKPEKEGPFTQLRISDARKDTVLDSQKELGRIEYEVKENIGIIGIAWCKDKTVALEFQLEKETDADGMVYWTLFHRRVFEKVDNNWAVVRPWSEVDLWGEEVKELLTRDQGDALNDLAAKSSLRFGEQAKPRSGESRKRFRIMGVRNPCPPYRSYQEALKNPTFKGVTEAERTEMAERAKRVDVHKDAVSGDYDLFAVWPVYALLGAENLIRRSEERKDVDESPPVFLPVKGKRFTVEAAGSPGLYIEIVPGGEQLREKEDATYGNINDAIFSVAMTLNSFSAAIYQKKASDVAPNVAFHSDEGGRPGVKDLEFPIAVFLPRALIPRIKTPDVKSPRTARLIKNEDEFLKLIKQLRGRCFIPLHYGWLAQLFKGKEQNDMAQNLLLGTLVQNPLLKEEPDAQLAILEELRTLFQKYSGKKTPNPVEPVVTEFVKIKALP